jgi:Arc/MetJ-type ribon-helix-helix transcriptional regulator
MAASCRLRRVHGHRELPDDLKRIIDRHIVEGRVVSEADYVKEALRRYAEHLELENDIDAGASRPRLELQTVISVPDAAGTPRDQGYQDLS